MRNCRLALGYRIGCLMALACATAASFAPLGAAHAAGATILHAEPLSSVNANGGAATLKPGAQGRKSLNFAAYGREFVLALEANGTLLEQLKPGVASSTLRLYRGSLQGVQRSWVRLAAKDDALSGMMWDGHDLYAIEPAAAVSGALATPLEAAATANVIFKLSDVLIDSGSAACASGEASRPQKADAAFASLVEELKGAPTIMEASGAARRLTVSALGDALFLQGHSTQQAARDAILARLNNVDGIFSSQLGVEVRVDSLTVHDAASQQLSAETAPNALLRELGRLRKRSPELSSRGLTHLFTGRDLDGTTIGIAYLDSLCHAEYGVGLTETRSAWLDSLVAAHEIGHNFGADHDGDSGGSCASTAPASYLMAATVNGSDDFSQCSRDRMHSRILAASCISSLPPANVRIAANLGQVRQRAAESFGWSLTVANSGGIDADNVNLEIAIPAALLVESASVSDGSCTHGAGIVQCALGTLDGGDTRTLDMTLHSETLGSYAITAAVSADGDASATDNAGAGSIAIEPEADLAMSLQGPAAATAGNAFNLNFNIQDATATGASAVSVVITLPAGMSALSASLANGNCSISSSEVRCTLVSLASGTTASGTVSLNASLSGAMTLQASVSGAYLDSNTANDQANLAVTVAAAAPTAAQSSASSTGGGGGGGGGASGWLLLLGLVGLRVGRCFQARYR